MRKFTVFTVILAITVIITVSEMFVNNYLPGLQGEEGGELSLSLPESLDLSKITKTNTFETDVTTNNQESLTNKLGADVEVVPKEEEVVATKPTTEVSDLTEFYGSYDTAIPTEQIQDLPQVPTVDNAESPENSNTGDFEDQNYSSVSVNVNLRQEQIDSAGFFNAYVEAETGDGKLYKTIDVTDLYDTKMQKFVIRSKEEMMAKVYIFSVGANTKIEELYQLIKSRCGQTPLVTINATNEYGSESFYMNDSSRSNTVFLTARIGQLVYGFSYPKNYHQQIKNLIQLITWEID